MNGTDEPRFRLGLARGALAWEHIWPAFWPAAGVAGLFIAIALFNVLPSLGGWLHALVLLLFAVAFGAAVWHGFNRIRLPDGPAALRRLERDSGLTHRPLSAVRDTMAGGSDPATAELWRLYQEQARRRMRNLKVRLPHPNLAARDPWALRAAVGLLLFVAAFGTRGDWGPRMAAAFTPNLDGTAQAASATLDVWVTPPDYTGLAPIFLRNAQPAPQTAKTDDSAPAAPTAIPIPTGSVLLARVSGGSGAPALTANGHASAFEQVDQVSYQISQPVTKGDIISVEQNGRSLGSWPIALVPDTAPIVALPAPPAAGERGALRLEYEARDDYGVVAVTGAIRLSGDVAEPGIDRTPVELPLPLPGVRPKTARSTSFHDLTPHPWAGLPVTLRVSATDGAGQTGTTEDVALVLPEREFRNPVARAIIEERKKLTLRPQAGREEAARSLGIISARPYQFHDDIVVFLSLRAAVARLYLDEAPDAVPAVQQLLWDTALRVEDGELSLAERKLRDAEQRLSEALNRDAPDQEVQKLMDELQQALNEFLDAMEEQMRQAMERGEQPPQIPPEMMGQTMDRQDIQEMLDQMRQMAETGSRDAAKEMLSQLQQMLENLRNGTMAQMQQNQQNQAGQMMQKMQDLAQRQRELLDQSFRESQQGEQGQQGQEGQQGQQGQQGQMPGRQRGQQQGQRGQQGQGQQGQQGKGQQGQQGQGSASAAQQEALRKELGELMRQLGEMGGEIPRPLGRAERAMRDAGQALQQGQPGAAVPPQTQALDELQQGLQSMAEQMAQQMMMGQQPGQMPGQPQMQQSNRGRDPLGRSLPSVGQTDSDEVRIPEQSDLQRAREILDELRRRAGEFDRPQLELDYIDRLLRRF